jgi:two-component system, sensor histidine kinase and response regulator
MMLFTRRLEKTMDNPDKEIAKVPAASRSFDERPLNPLVDEQQILKRMSVTSGEVFWTADLNFQTQYVSPSVYYLTGETPEEHKKKGITDKFTPESVAILLRAYEDRNKQVLEGNADPNEGLRVDVEHYDNAGGRFWVQISAIGVRDEKGQLIGIQGITRNIHEAKTAQLKLAQSEARFRMLAENLHGVIYLCHNDQRFRTVYISESIYDLLGYPAEMFISDELSFAELYHPDDQARVYDAVDKCITEGKAFHLIYRAKHRDGTWRWIEEKGKTIAGERGEKLLEGFLSDVSERIAREEQVRESESRFEQLFNANNDSISLVYLLPNGELSNFIEINDAAGEVIGYSKEELLQMGIQDLEEPTSAAEIEKRINEIKQNGFSRFETRFVAKDGAIVTLDVKTKLIEYQGRPALLNIGRDITQSKIDRKKLEESEEKFLKAFHNSPNIIGLSDLETGEYLEVNHTFTHKTGYTLEDIKGRKVADLLQLDPEFRRQAMEQLCKNGCVRDLETVIYTKANQPMQVSLSADLITIQGKQYNLTTGMDIGPIKQAEKELIRAKELAEESNRLKSHFLSNMSHELRTPLNGIMGFAQLLKERLQGEDDLEMANMIYSSGQRLLKTLNNILELSKIDAGKIQMQSQAVELVTLSKNAVKLFSPLALSKGMELQFKSSFSKLVVQSDDHILEKIIQELIHNAIAYTHEGIILLELYALESGDEKEIILAVSDPGIGITTEHQKQIFEPFRQASEGWNRSFEGTGLGLTICERYARALGAEIRLISEPGMGSTFSIVLPYSLVLDKDLQKEQYPDHSEVQVLPTAKAPARILLVDDDNLCETLVKHMLDAYAIVDYAASAVDALQMLNDGTYELILLDINLRRGIDGTQLLTQIREMPKYHDTPLIALTAYASEEERNALLDHGFSAHLSKPFLANDLRDIVKKWSKKGSGE